MKVFKRLAGSSALVLASISSCGVLAESFPGIEKLMKEDEFHASGLHKLSEQERNALNQWLIRYTATEASLIRKSVPVVQKEVEKQIESHIDGVFVGWSGKTVFSLKNGQQWRQRTEGVWKTSRESPEVLIKRNFFGFYEMELVGTSRSIGVKRIR